MVCALLGRTSGLIASFCQGLIKRPGFLPGFFTLSKIRVSRGITLNNDRLCCDFPVFGVYSMPASYKTVGGHAACLSEEWLDDIISFAVAKDTGSFQVYLDSQKCIILKAGLPVTITDAGFIVHEIVINGIKLWVPVEAITK